MHEFETDQARQLCDQLARLLVKERSLNEFLEVALPRVATALDASEVALVDYYEQTERFALLHMEGLGTDIYEFQKRQEELDLRKALKETDPFHPGGARDRLVLPLRFSETLEAVLFLESDHALELTPARRECARVASRLLGLLMSSSRLAVNRRFHFEARSLRGRKIGRSSRPFLGLLSMYFESFGPSNTRNLMFYCHLGPMDSPKTVLLRTLLVTCRELEKSSLASCPRRIPPRSIARFMA